MKMKIAGKSFSLGVIFGFFSLIAMAAYVPYAVTSGANKQRVERAAVLSTCSSSPCTITSQSGSWLTTITRTGTGQYSLNFAANTFTAAPTCVGSYGSTFTGWMFFQTVSSSAATLETRNTSNAATDSQFNVICMGPR